MEHNTLIINLFGGPGTGKSSLMAKLFARLKELDYDVEMSHEYVKDLVWEESYKKIENQLYIFGKQHNRAYRLLNKINIIITDSPLLNSIVYYTGDNPYFKDMVMWEYNEMNNIGLYLERSFDYNEVGRYQNLEQAIEVDVKYKKLLVENNIEHTTLKFPDYDLDELIEMIKDRL
jgi:nicotinamide riboside kinase